MSTNTMTSSTPNKGQVKSSKLSKTVILRLRSDLLAKFPSTTPPAPNGSSTSSNGIASPKVNGHADAASEANGTPAASTQPEGTPDGIVKRRGGPGSRPGNKRTASTLDAGKPKGRPGPKKKPRLADGTIDRSNDAVKPAANHTAAAHKLGPKANTGAINAGLRALDRSGKPCRKWDRKGFNLKSFTGVAWGIDSWRAPVRSISAFSGDVKSDSSSTGDIKPTMESSAVPSESSRGGDGAAIQLNGIESSPAPIAA